MVGDQTIDHFLEELAGGTAEPGGGAATALMAATGAALVSMACGLTIGREKYRQQEAAMIRARRDAEALRTQALSLVADDIQAFREVTAAYGLPRGTGAEKDERTACVQAALKGATEVPLHIAILASRVVELCSDVVADVNPNAAGDLAVGALAARGAVDGAVLSVKINLRLIRDSTFQTRVDEQLQDKSAMARASADHVIRTVEART
ncbi:MAG: cyclodeaminase/cyclohydrolase family protein [Chloroflexota bacterium]